jgi:toxin ParE1/3/4
MSLYQISDAAEEDWHNIVNYTLTQHGETQTRKYMAALEKGIEKMAAGELPYKNLDDVYPVLRSKKCEHHYIFGVMRTHAPMLVVAILHERMDLMVQLQSRLN